MLSAEALFAPHFPAYFLVPKSCPEIAAFQSFFIFFISSLLVPHFMLPNEVGYIELMCTPPLMLQLRGILQPTLLLLLLGRLNTEPLMLPMPCKAEHIKVDIELTQVQLGLHKRRGRLPFIELIAVGCCHECRITDGF